MSIRSTYTEHRPTRRSQRHVDGRPARHRRRGARAGREPVAPRRRSSSGRCCRRWTPPPRSPASRPPRGRLNARAAVAAILRPAAHAGADGRAGDAGRHRVETPTPETPARRSADAAPPPVVQPPVSAPAPVVRQPAHARAGGRRACSTSTSAARSRAPRASCASRSSSRSPATVRFTVTAKGKSFGTWTRAGAPRRQPVHAHAQAADRQDAQARQLHAVGRAQWEREALPPRSASGNPARQRHRRQLVGGRAGERARLQLAGDVDQLVALGRRELAGVADELARRDGARRASARRCDGGRAARAGGSR